MSIPDYSVGRLYPRVLIRFCNDVSLGLM